MNKVILEYLASQRTCVLAVEMPDGSPHAATVHFANSENPLVFYFETFKNYRKAQPILTGKPVRATLVVGTTESEMKTVQMDGIVTLLKNDEMDTYVSVYLGKFPEKKEKSKDPDFIRFKFTPTWWRFTDWKTPQGKMIISSEEK